MSDDKGAPIKDVWVDNLESAFDQIRELVDAYPYVAMVRSTAVVWLTTLCMLFKDCRAAQIVVDWTIC